MKHLILAFLLISTSAHACKDSMQFTTDKQQHFATSAAFGMAARTVTSDNMAAIGLALIPGIAKEAYDSTGKGCPSFNDMAWNIIGATVGVYSANWVIGPQNVVFRMQF